MKFYTALKNEKTLEQLKKLSWTDFEGQYFNDFSENKFRISEILPEFVQLLKKIKLQMKKEKISTNHMIIDECPIWGEYTVLSFKDKETSTYFNIEITISKVDMQCVAEVIAIEESSGVIEKDFDNIQDVLNATFTKK